MKSTTFTAMASVRALRDAQILELKGQIQVIMDLLTQDTRIPVIEARMAGWYTAYEGRRAQYDMARREFGSMWESYYEGRPYGGWLAVRPSEELQAKKSEAVDAAKAHMEAAFAKWNSLAREKSEVERPYLLKMYDLRDKINELRK